jgi:two-component system alkaline phosphatase synthesis response regulator PhoP
MSPRVLVIEDEDPIRMSIADALRTEGFEVLEASEGVTGERMALCDGPDLVLLDLMLPGKDGFSILRTLRGDRLAVPIILLTARGEEFDRVQGFEFGADDYVVKPFSMAELLLRVRALIARSGGGAPGVPGSSDRALFGETEVNFAAFSVVCAGRTAALSRRELELLSYFLRFEGETLDRYRLLSDVWGPDDDPTTRTVDQHVLKLRKKIEPDPANPRHLITVRNVGYRFSRAPRALK